AFRDIAFYQHFQQRLGSIIHTSVHCNIPPAAPSSAARTVNPYICVMPQPYNRLYYSTKSSRHSLMHFNTIAIVGRYQDRGLDAPLRELAASIEGMGGRVLVESDTARNT